MFGKRLIAICSTTGLFACGVAVLALIAPSNVGASGSKHKVVLKGSGGTAVEGAAIAVFACDETKGKYTVTVSNVQVIQPDHFTSWPADPNLTGSHYGIHWVLAASGLGADQGGFPLSQDAKSGLYGGSATGTLSNSARCAKGATVDVADETGSGGNTHEWLLLQKPLP